LEDNSDRKLEEYLVDGLKGVELSQIARQRGVSRQAIYQLLHKRLKKRFAEQYQQLKTKYQIEKNLPLWVLRVEHAMFTEVGERHVRPKRSVSKREPKRRTRIQDGRAEGHAAGELHATDQMEV
jgi:predicted DNA-binding protein YlxM (UPF0122 family)